MRTILKSAWSQVIKLKNTQEVVSTNIMAWTRKTIVISVKSICIHQSQNNNEKTHRTLIVVLSLTTCRKSSPLNKTVARKVSRYEAKTHRSNILTKPFLEKCQHERFSAPLFVWIWVATSVMHDVISNWTCGVVQVMQKPVSWNFPRSSLSRGTGFLRQQISGFWSHFLNKLFLCMQTWNERKLMSLLVR